MNRHVSLSFTCLRSLTRHIHPSFLSYRSTFFSLHTGLNSERKPTWWSRVWWLPKFASNYVTRKPSIVQRDASISCTSNKGNPLDFLTQYFSRYKLDFLSFSLFSRLRCPSLRKSVFISMESRVFDLMNFSSNRFCFLSTMCWNLVSFSFSFCALTHTS